MALISLAQSDEGKAIPASLLGEVIDLQKSGKKGLDSGKRRMDTFVVYAAVSILPITKAGQAHVVWSVFWFLGNSSCVPSGVAANAGQWAASSLAKVFQLPRLETSRPLKYWHSACRTGSGISGGNSRAPRLIKTASLSSSTSAGDRDSASMIAAVIFGLGSF
jgi:hypothetical protein